MLKLLLLVGLLGVGWWLLGRGRKARSGQEMTPAEARALLGLGPGADPAAVRLAHRRLMSRVHPDAGGTAELARRANLARDIALAALPPHDPQPERPE